MDLKIKQGYCKASFYLMAEREVLFGASAPRPPGQCHPFTMGSPDLPRFARSSNPTMYTYTEGSNLLSRYLLPLKPLKRASGVVSMAEREGFEPSVRVSVHTLSRRAPSTARTPLLRPTQYYIADDNVLFKRSSSTSALLRD